MTSSSSTPGNSLIGPSTSSIRRKHAAAHRTHMACVPCRDAKHKCDGVAPPVVLYAPPGGASREAVVSEQPCSRCAAQSLPCVWQPKAKLGRPRKESSASMPGSTSTTSSSSVISPARPLAPLSIPAPTPVAGSSSATSDYFSSPGAATRSAPVTPAALGLGLSQLFSPPPAPTPALHPILNTSHRPISRFNVRPGSPIRDGIQAYFALGLRCCLAFLPSSRDTIETLLDKFSTTIATTPSMTALPSEARRVLCLGRILAVVGLRLRDDASGGGPPASMRAESETSMRAAIWDDLYQCSRQDIDEDPLEATANSPQNVVFALQTLLLGSMLEYGLGDIQRARSIMERALSIVEVLRINLLDAPGNQPQGRVPEELRRTFWELCITDVLLCVATSGDPARCFVRRGLYLSVNFPTEGEEKHADSRAGYELRMRSASLLLESVQTIGPSHSAKDRLYNLFGISNDLDGQIAIRRQTASSDRSIEMVHSAVYMVNAARIHMVRATLFSSLDYGIHSSSLQPTNERIDGGMTHFAQAQALVCMVQAASEIVRVGEEQPSQAQPPLVGSVGYNPLYCSVRVVGAFGLLAFITMHAGAAAAAASLGQLTVRDRRVWETGATETVRDRRIYETEGEDGHAGKGPGAGIGGDGGDGRRDDGTSGFNMSPSAGEAKTKLAETPAALTMMSSVWPVAGRLAVESAGLWAIGSQAY